MKRLIFVMCLALAAWVLFSAWKRPEDREHLKALGSNAVAVHREELLRLADQVKDLLENVSRTAPNIKPREAE